MPKPPSCPKCGHVGFIEEQSVAAEQNLDWNEKEKCFIWGSRRTFHECVDGDSLHCAKCREQVPMNFCEDWME